MSSSHHPWDDVSTWKDEKAYMNWLRSSIRKIWSRHPVKISYIHEHRFKSNIGKRTKRNPSGLVWACRCECCKEVFRQTDCQVDHIDGNRKNNSISNLRVVSNMENHRNMKRSKSNKSGITGVSFHQRDKLWLSSIKVNYKTITLGCYKDFFLACCARKSAEIKYGFHANHGRL